MFPDIITLQGPEDRGCGEFLWSVRWQLPYAATHDGHIVQEIAAAFTIENADGSSYMQRRIHFWEAWPILKGEQTTAFSGYDDVYRSSPYKHTKGSVTITGTAKFFGNVLPNDFKPNNPRVLFAGSLPSTATQPSFWDGTGTIHNLECMWDCIKQPFLSTVTAQAGGSTFVVEK